MKSIIAIFLITLCSTFAAENLPLLKISSTSQEYNIAQPWEKKPTRTRRGIGVLVGKNQIITTAEMGADATFIEIETVDSKTAMPAKTIAIDYEANLALISVTDPAHQELIGKMLPLEIAPSPKLDDKVKAYQVEDNGKTLVTNGIIRGADVVSSFVDGHYFLAFEIKASMQGAANSFTIPVLKDGKLLGLLTSYSSDEQLLDVTAPEIIKAFLTDVNDGDYVGFPSLGISITRTSDPHFRSWLKLDDDQGGLFIQRVARNSSAQNADIKEGDVLLAIDGHTLDRKGFYQSENYGPLYWGHLVGGSKKTGEKITLSLLRDGSPITKEVTLTRRPEGIIPSHMYGKAPRYLIKGGFIFQELTSSYLQAFGEKWETRAPIELLDALNHPEDYEKDRNRLVILSRTIPTEATLGYERIASVIVTKVNGKDIADIPTLVQAFKTPDQNGIHTIEIDNDLKKLYLDAASAAKVETNFLKQGLPSLSRTKE
ncbi:MAG: PDZ domain-containing protein [Akkermansiaceae bacterium]